MCCGIIDITTHKWIRSIKLNKCILTYLFHVCFLNLNIKKGLWLYISNLLLFCPEEISSASGNHSNIWPLRTDWWCLLPEIYAWAQINCYTELSGNFSLQELPNTPQLTDQHRLWVVFCEYKFALAMPHAGTVKTISTILKMIWGTPQAHLYI